jgi:hypothetical protein
LVPLYAMACTLPSNIGTTDDRVLIADAGAAATAVVTTTRVRDRAAARAKWRNRTCH